MSAKAVVLSSIALAAAATAQGGPPPIPVELRSRFGFDGPLVVKIGDGIDELRLLDVDGDGRKEVVVTDARRARLAVVRVKDKATTLDGIPTDGQIAAYAVADVHGDGVPDLMTVDARGRLSVRHPGKPATTPPIDLGLGGRGTELHVGDLDGDGKADLVAISRAGLRVATRLGDAPVLSPIEAVEDNASGFRLVDLDGDADLDLVAVAPGSNKNLRLRPGRGDGTFDAWRVLGVDGLRALWPTQTADGKPALAVIAGRLGSVSVRSWIEQGDEPALSWWAIPEAGPKALPFAVGDVDGDGDEDLVLARPDRAQLLVHEWRDGTFVVRAVPTLAGVASMAFGDVDQDGTQDLVLTSPEEDVVAWHSGKDPLDRFPASLPSVDKPLCAVVERTGGVLVMGRTEKREGHLHRTAPGAAPQKVADLGRLPGDPVRLLLGDFGDQQGSEVAFVVPGEGLRTMTLGAEAKANGKPTETAGFTRKLDDGALAVRAVGDEPALVAVRERFVRTFRLDDKGQVRVLAQDNGPDGLAELSLCAETEENGVRARLYLDRKNDKLVRVVDGKAPIAVEVPQLDFATLLAHRGAALLLSPRGVLRVPFDNGAGLRQIASHDPPVERTAYWLGVSGDLDHDGVTDLAVVDGHLPGFQVLAGSPDGLRRALAVPVFERGPSQEPENEPRAIAAGDLDGDGRCDLALIAHDRVLVYLQQP